MKVECALIEKNYDLIKEANFLNNYKLMMIMWATSLIVFIIFCYFWKTKFPNFKLFLIGCASL